MVAPLTIALALLIAAVFGFPGGQAVVTQERDVEHVVIRRLDNVVESDSYCDRSSGRYAQIVRLGNALLAAAKHNDARAIVALVRYPLRVNVSSESRGVARSVRTEYIADRRALLSKYASVVTPHVLGLLRAIEPHDVFCRNGMASLGGGLVWVESVAGSQVKIAVLNR